MGIPVEPEVKRIFATDAPVTEADVFSPTAALVASSAGSECSCWPPSPAITRGSPASTPMAAANGATVSTYTAPGCTRPEITLSRSWSLLCSEYATLTGTTGTPARYAPMVTRKWPIELPDRIISGRCAERPRSSRAWPTESAAATTSP